MSDVAGEVNGALSEPSEVAAPSSTNPADERFVPGPDGKPIVDRRRPESERRPAHPRVSVIVPAKNEAPNIREILPYLAPFYEVIVVVSKDDHDSAEAARAALPSARVIFQTRKGKGNAMACGFAAATGHAIVMFDIDGSADPHEIPRFIKALTEGADLAKGSRFCEGGGSQDITLIRAAGNWGLNLLASVLTNTRFTDLCYGYNAFWADQLYMLDLPQLDIENASDMVRGDGFEIEAAEQSGAGLTPTFPANTSTPPLIGIDHILTFNSSANDAHAVRIPGSDHLGVSATVHLPR